MLAASCLHASAQSPEVPRRSPGTITVKFDSIHLSEAAGQLGRAAGVRVSLGPGVPDPAVSAVFINMSFEGALQTLVTGACLDYLATDSRHVVITRSNSGEEAQLVPGPNVVTWPHCTDGYKPPRLLDLRTSGWQTLGR
jgi:hypothetical protein